MIPRMFAIVHRMTQMVRIKDPEPYRIVRIVPDAECANLMYLEDIGRENIEAIAVFEWDLYHGCSFKFAGRHVPGKGIEQVSFRAFDNPLLRAHLSQKFSDHIQAWCLEELARASAPKGGIACNPNRTQSPPAEKKSSGQ